MVKNFIMKPVVCAFNFACIVLGGGGGTMGQGENLRVKEGSLREAGKEKA